MSATNCPKGCELTLHDLKGTGCPGWTCDKCSSSNPGDSTPTYCCDDFSHNWTVCKDWFENAGVSGGTKSNWGLLWEKIAF